MVNPLNTPGPGNSHDHEYDKREARDEAVERLAHQIGLNLEAGSDQLFKYAGYDVQLIESVCDAIWEYAERQANKEIPR